MVDHTEFFAFKDGASFVWNGLLEALPDWVDIGWLAHHNGEQALAVPKGDPLGQPYVTDYAHKGDTILTNAAKDRFLVVSGDPNDVEQPTSNAPTNWLAPPQPPAS